MTTAAGTASKIERAIRRVRKHIRKLAAGTTDVLGASEFELCTMRVIDAARDDLLRLGTGDVHLCVSTWEIYEQLGNEKREALEAGREARRAHLAAELRRVNDEIRDARRNEPR